MPAKKAPAAEAAPKAAPNKNVKAEKPVEEKKQAGGQRDAGAPAKAGQQKPQQGGQAQPAQLQHALSSDPAEAAIQKKMNDIDARINKYRGDLEKIAKDFDNVKQVREEYYAEQRRLRDKISEDRGNSALVSNQRKDTFVKLQEFQRVKNLKKDEAKKIKEKLPYAPANDDSPAAQEAYLKKLDDDIRTLEKGLAANAFSLQQEKKKVEEISQLRQAKKIYKDYTAVLEKINLDSKNINDLRTELDKTKESHEVSQDERKQAKAQLDEIAKKIAESKTQGDEILAKRKPIQESIESSRAELAKEKEKLYEVRKRRGEELKLQREKERERQTAMRLEREEKRKERDAERTKQELLKTPYEDEIYHCVSLVTYLESLLPPKPKEVAATTPSSTPEGASDVTILKKDDGEDNFGGKKKAKKQKPVKVTQDLKHNVEVFLQFETLSLTPPSKLADVEASISEVKAKKEHYNKLSAAAVKERQDAAAAAASTKAQESAPAEPKPETPAKEEAVATE